MNAETYTFITRKLQQAIENGSTPGIALLVDKQGEVVYRHALGQAQVYPEHRPLTEDALFDIASLTKVVATTTAIMLLVQEQQITLTDPIAKYIPKFPHHQITLTHLLTHSAGFPAWLPLYEAVQHEAQRQGDALIGSPEAKQLIMQQIYRIDLAYAPGTQYIYTDMGFILLGEMIERISGTRLDWYCEEMIFAPLHMSHTFFRRRGEPLPEGNYAATERCEWRRRIICGEVHDENAYAIGGVAGHAGLFSTLDDIGQFMRVLYACYHDQDTFIPAPIVRQFFSRQLLPKDSTRALGWDTPSKKDSTAGEVLSRNSVGHTGFTGTSVWCDLDRGVTILLFSNRIHPSRNNQRFLKMRPKIHDTVVITIDRMS